jgi:hypothetical protein
MIGGFASIRGADSQDEARVKRPFHIRHYVSCQAGLHQSCQLDSPSARHVNPFCQHDLDAGHPGHGVRGGAVDYQLSLVLERDHRGADVVPKMPFSSIRIGAMAARRLRRDWNTQRCGDLHEIGLTTHTHLVKQAQQMRFDGAAPNPQGRCSL